MTTDALWSVVEDLDVSGLSAGAVALPRIDLCLQPHLAAPPAEIDDGARHIGVPPLVERNGVPLGQPKNVRNASCVDQIINVHQTGHGNRAYKRWHS